MENQISDIKLKIAESIIRERFSFLEYDFGYVAKLIAETEPPFVEQIKVKYFNNNKNRSILIGCSKGYVINELKYTFTVSIIRMPYLSIEDYFSLNVFMQKNGQDINTTFDKEFTEAETFIVTTKLSESLQEHAQKIIDGSQWLCNYYPRKD